MVRQYGRAVDRMGQNRQADRQAEGRQKSRKVNSMRQNRQAEKQKGGQDGADRQSAGE